MTHSLKVRVDQLEFDCLASGDPSHPLVILLHGFPESSYMWRTLMAELSAAGFYCIAPDMRGYSPGAAPSGKKAYTIDKLAGDILAIASRFQNEFHLIAHDWGAAIGWYLAYHESERVLSYSALSVPHHSAFGKALKMDKVQQKKSRYMAWFQIPLLPELYLRRNDFAFFRKLWRRSGEEEVQHNLQIFRHKGSLSAALNYYRANLKTFRDRKIGKIEIPTLFIWGNRDIAIGELAARGNAKYMSGKYQFLEIEGGHWLIQSNYSEVKEAILKHLSA